MAVVLTFEDLVMSSEPTLAWNQDIAIAPEDHMMKTRVSNKRLEGFRWNVNV